MQRRRKVTRAKFMFLKEQPKKPKAAVIGFINDSAKRAEAQKKFPELEGKALQPKLMEMWSRLSDDEQKPYLEKANEDIAEFKTKTEDFKNSENWKAYVKATQVFKLKAKAKAKGKGKGAPAAALPDDKKKALQEKAERAKRENLPKKPLSGFSLYSRSQRQAGIISTKSEILGIWSKLGADVQKQWNDQSTEQNKQYKIECKIFQKSAEGKKYMREKKGFDKKQKERSLKQKLLSRLQEPKRPQSAFFLFCAQKHSTIKAGLPLEMLEITKMWSDLKPEDKRVFEDTADALKNEYTQNMVKFRNNPAYQRYKRAMIDVSVAAKNTPWPRPSARARP